jgi:hypothetical protein
MFSFSVTVVAAGGAAHGVGTTAQAAFIGKGVGWFR